MDFISEVYTPLPADATTDTLKNELVLLRLMKIIVKKLKVVFKCAPKKRVRLHFAFGLPTNKNESNTYMEIKITNEQKVKVTLTPKTDTGKPAPLDGVPSWQVLSGNSRVEQADDGMSAYLISGDDPGDTEVIVKADADLGEGTEEISDILRLSVVGATAKNLGIAVGTPEPK